MKGLRRKGRGCNEVFPLDFDNYLSIQVMEILFKIKFVSR
jgi:hypothetical protein